MERPTWKKVCKNCNKEFEFHAFRTEVNKRFFCCKLCANKANAKRNSESKKGAKNPMFGRHAWNYRIFGKEYPSRQGKNCHFWRGGTSDESKLARKTWKWKNWRQNVFKRDNWTCQICGEKGGKIVPHHIKLFRFFINDRYKLINGITLCKQCHRGLHNKFPNQKIVAIPKE